MAKVDNTQRHRTTKMQMPLPIICPLLHIENFIKNSRICGSSNNYVLVLLVFALTRLAIRFLVKAKAIH